MRPYQLLPFRFHDFKNENMLLVNEVGEFLFSSKEEFNNMISYKLDPESETFLDLKSKQILTDTEIEPVIKMLATKYRTKKSFLYDFTTLHMVVPTLRCNSKCKYCQVSSKSEEAFKYDMDKSTAKRTVDLIFLSPSPNIKIEFQGGEPLLSFEIVKYIIEYAEQCNLTKKKQLEFVICTNLTLITEEMLKYLQNHKVYISTSLDGTMALHNNNRPFRNGQGSYDIVTKNIKKVREYLGEDSVSALMTATNDSLEYFTEIVDEYLVQGFSAIFMRSLNPYGSAKRDMYSLGYRVEDFIESYKRAFKHIVNINLNGTFFVECYASLLLGKILTPFSAGFVDLQSPSGVAICGVIYNHDGNVYVSDEARMLANDGDTTFSMGNVNENTYQELFHSDKIVSLIKKSCLECLPICSHCVFQSYCGVDPIRNYAEQGEVVGNRMMSTVCKINMAIFQCLFELIKENDKPTMDVLWSWITRKPIVMEKQVSHESN
jgi:His-Xaa-Ser system radical SAM maturase HxsB